MIAVFQEGDTNLFFCELSVPELEISSVLCLPVFVEVDYQTATQQSFALARGRLLERGAVRPIAHRGLGSPARARGGYIATNGTSRRRAQVHERDHRGRDEQD